MTSSCNLLILLWSFQMRIRLPNWLNIQTQSPLKWRLRGFSEYIALKCHVQNSPHRFVTNIWIRKIFYFNMLTPKTWTNSLSCVCGLKIVSDSFFCGNLIYRSELGIFIFLRNKILWSNKTISCEIVRRPLIKI